MKKVLYLFLFAFVCFAFFVPKAQFASAAPQQVRVIFNQTRIFNTSDFSEITAQQQLEQITIKTAQLHEVFDVVAEQEDFYLIEVSAGVLGYVQKIAVIDNSITSPKTYLQTNATLKTQTKVFEKINNTFIEQPLQLPSGTRLRLLNGFDKSTQYTLVSFEQQNQVYTYYVKTNLVDPDGIDRNILLAITLIISALSIGALLTKILKPKIKTK
jgi:hypothetical protein